VSQERPGSAISVVIVNFRTKELTVAAAVSALQEREVGQVIVVDNASGDGSPEFLRAKLPAPTVRIIEATANLGFGRANNLAMTEVTSELVLLLNSDATLVPGAVGTLATALVSDSSVGLVAPAVLEADGRTLQPDTHGRFPRLVENPFRGAAEDATVVDWASGVAMMLRRRDYLDVGGFDEDFDMYLEDVDLCRRLGVQGKVVLRVPAARVIHLGGQSWLSSVDKRGHYHRSKIIYFRKAGSGPAQMALLQLQRALRLALSRLSHRFGRRDPRPLPPRSTP